MSQDSGRNFTPRKKNALDNYAFNIRVPVPNEKGKFSSLNWEISRNSLGIKIYTGFSSDQGNQGGMLRARLDGISFYAFLELIKVALEAKEEWKGKIEYSDYTFFGGKRSDAPQLVSTVYVGRNSEGMIWISVIDNTKKDRPRIQFPFGCGRNHKLKHADGADYSIAEQSQLVAKAYYNMLSNLGSMVAVREYVEPPKKEFNRGGNNNGGNNYSNNNNNNSGSNYNNNYEDSEIPF